VNDVEASRARNVRTTWIIGAIAVAALVVSCLYAVETDDRRWYGYGLIVGVVMTVGILLYRRRAGDSADLRRIVVVGVTLMFLPGLLVRDASQTQILLGLLLPAACYILVWCGIWLRRYRRAAPEASP